MHEGTSNCRWSRRRLTSRWLAMWMLFAVSCPTIAAEISVDIPAGPLGQALSRFAGQAGVTLSFDPALTRGVTAPRLSGRYDVQSGFVELLHGTDLEVVRDAAGELTLRRRATVPRAPSPAVPSGTDAGAVQSLPDVTVEGVESTEIGPHRGLRLTRDQIPGNIQSSSGEDIQQSGATSLTDFMNSQLQSVNINSYSGNPFQADVNYRGFTASPQIGTPQGLSVFFDGVRMNEPFGDVVNWDMIPLNAISTFDVAPGSNPLYGLNTLGGALNLRTRNGFDDPGARISLEGGSWGRIHGQLSGGGTYGDLGGFVALTGFHEDGWRTNSPSDLKQGFAKLTYRNGPLELNGSTLLVGDDLLGNGLIPRELYDNDPEAVFTSPDQTKNTLRQFSLDGLFEINDRVNVTAQIYHRQSDRSAVGGDIYEDFDDMGGNVPNRIARRVVGRTLTRQDPNTGLPIEGGPACQYQDVNRDGVRDYDLLLDFNTFTPEPNSLNTPLRPFYTQNEPRLRQLAVDFLGDQDLTFSDFLTSPFIAYRQPLNGVAGIDCAQVTYQFSDGQRNGKAGQTAETRRGIVEGTPIGVITRSSIEQESNGASLQLNFNLDKHAFMLGTSFDANTAQYSNLQRLALIDASHNVYEDIVNIDPIFYAATHDIPVNEFDGFSNTLSAYFSETFSPFDNLHLTASGRYNRTQVKNNLMVSRTSDVNLASRTDYDAGLPEYILCPTSDPASCPTELNGSTFTELARLDPSQDPLVREGHAEKFLYHSFNPSFGINFLPVPDVNLYANWSQGTRAPSVVELGCAFDATPLWRNQTTGEWVPYPVPDLNGNPQVPTARSLTQLNGSCSLPSTLSGDPFLPQIMARTTEAGVRGTLPNGWEWNAGLYRTNLFDDLYFVSITAERSYFDTIGDTRRQGFELGLRGSYRDFDFSVNYGLTEATFESEFWITSRHNISAISDGTVLNNRGQIAVDQIRVMPGDRIPGMPLHNLNASLTYHASEKWEIGLTMITHSASFVRGNENNDQRGGCFTLAADPITGAGRYVPCDAQTAIVAQDFFGPGQVPGYMIFNARSRFEVAKGLTVFGEIDNLFDKDYFTAGRLGINPFSPSIEGAIGPSGWNYNSNDWRGTTFVGPGGPRAFWIGLEYRF